MTLPELETLMTQWLASDATDVLLSEGQTIRLRINGELLPLESPPLSHADLSALWQACGTHPEQEEERDIRHLTASGIYLRINLYRAMGKLCAAIRPIKNEIPPLDSLGLPCPILRSWTQRRSGLILVTGATGAGKSTTLASLLDDLNHSLNGHIITLEDPIEYLFKNHQSYFSQRELNSDTQDFSTALRAALRQNPDVIMIGEIRDEESALLALRAAETGHLVLSTLHSSGVVESIERLCNLFPKGSRSTSLMLLSRQLIGVITQNLLPGIDGHLKLACEYLENDGATRNWIREGKHRELTDFLLRPQQANTRDMLSSIIELYQKGTISEETARQSSPTPSDFDRQVRGIS